MPNIVDNKVTTITLVLDAFLTLLEKRVEGLNFIYDESLTIENALTKWRAKNEREEIQDSTAFPLFSFNRSVLRYPEQGIARRSVTQKAIVKPELPSTEAVVYRMLYGTFDINFAMYHRSMNMQEVFEVDYLSEDGFSGQKEFIVSISDLGDHPHYAEFSPLTEKVVNSDGIYYKSTLGTISITGWYFVLQGTGQLIKEINAQICDFDTKVVMSSFQLTTTT